MRRSVLLSLAVLIGACAGPQGGHACTEIGCVDGLTLQPAAGTTWAPGAYRFELEVDGETVTCTGALPLPPCGPPAITCDRERVVTITESGCALPPSQHGFGDLHFPGAPETVTIEIERDGRTLTRQTFTPTYQTTQPNGPGCPPTCTQGSETFALEAD